MSSNRIGLLLSLLLLGGCGAKIINGTQVHTTIDKARTQTCQNELEESVRILTKSRRLTVSKDIFSESSYLYLTNRIVNDRRGKKTLLLYIQDDRLYMGLLDKKEDIVKQREIKECHR